MKYLLVGGTGAMGSDLIKILSNDSNNEIFITSRSNRENKKNIKYLYGNAKNDDMFVNDITNQKYDAIIDFMIYDDLSVFKKRVESYLKCTNNYILLSSSRVYSDDRIITEKTSRLFDTSPDKKYIKLNEYANNKSKEENILKNIGGNNYTIVRPYITYNIYRLQLGLFEKEDWLYRALTGRTIVFNKDILDKMTTMSYGYDVAEQLAELMKNPGSGEVYQITTNSSVTWEDIVNIYKNAYYKYTGKELKIKYIDNLYFKNLYKKNNYQYRYDRKYNRIFDSSKLYNKTGIAIKNNLEKTLEFCIKEFLDNPKWGYINYRSEAIKDKLTNERISLKNINGNKNKLKYFLYRYTILNYFK